MYFAWLILITNIFLCLLLLFRMHNLNISLVIKQTISRQCSAAAAAKQLVLSLGSLQMAVGGKCLHFLKL